MADMPVADAYWINPAGKILPVDTNHIDKVIKNPDQYGLTEKEIEALYRSENETMGSEGKAREKIILSLIGKGWIRLRNYKRNGMWTANVPRLNKQSKDFLYQWAKTIVGLQPNVKYDIVKIDSPHQQLSASIQDIADDYLYTVEEVMEKPKKDFKYFLETLQTAKELNLKKEDFNVKYDHYGYQITYKGKNIGGAGVIKREVKRRNPSNLKLYKEQGAADIQKILDGKGERRFYDAIKKIDGGEE